LQPTPLYIIQLNASNTLPDHGGIATYTHELAFHLSRAETEVHLLTYPAEEREEMALPYSIHRSPSFDLRPLILRGGKRMDLLTLLPMKILAMSLQTWKTIRDLPDKGAKRILWALNWWPEAIVAYLVSRLCRVPYLVTAHGYEAFVPCDAKRHFLYEAVMNRAERVFAVSNHTADILVRCGVSEDRTRVIHNGVAPERFRVRSGSKPPLPEGMKSLTALEGRFLLVTISRLVPRKGHAAILKAMKRLEARIPGLQYVAAGSGPLKEELEREARNLGLEDRVRFIGEISEEEKVALLHACDVFVMPNRDILFPGGNLDTEGLGIVFLEAAACEKPVIGGRAGGVPEVVHHGRTGFLVDPHDPIDLEQAILSLWTDQVLRLRMGKAGRALVEGESSWKTISERYLKEMVEIAREETASR